MRLERGGGARGIGGVRDRRLMEGSTALGKREKKTKGLAAALTQGDQSFTYAP